MVVDHLYYRMPFMDIGLSKFFKLNNTDGCACHPLWFESLVNCDALVLWPLLQISFCKHRSGLIAYGGAEWRLKLISVNLIGNHSSGIRPLSSLGKSYSYFHIHHAHHSLSLLSRIFLKLGCPFLFPLTNFRTQLGLSSSMELSEGNSMTYTPKFS